MLGGGFGARARLRPARSSGLVPCLRRAIWFRGTFARVLLNLTVSSYARSERKQTPSRHVRTEQGVGEPRTIDEECPGLPPLPADVRLIDAREGTDTSLALRRAS